jgi:hypothetical protein
MQAVDELAWLDDEEQEPIGERPSCYWGWSNLFGLWNWGGSGCEERHKAYADVRGTVSVVQAAEDRQPPPNPYLPLAPTSSTASDSSAPFKNFIDGLGNTIRDQATNLGNTVLDATLGVADR